MFTNENPKVIHLKIFGCPVYLDVTKEKISKLDPSWKKRIFVGYSDQLKFYKIYILGFCQIKININITFDEDENFNKSRKNYVYEDHEEEQEAPRIVEDSKPLVRNVEEEPIPKYHDMEEPQGPMETHHEMISTNKIPTWTHDIIQEAERYGASERCKRPRL